jgi:CheY-like chemotaxis protein
MVVDDDPDSALLMQHVLGVRGGMDVTLVLDPNEAVVLAEKQPNASTASEIRIWPATAHPGRVFEQESMTVAR